MHTAVAIMTEVLTIMAKVLTIKDIRTIIIITSILITLVATTNTTIVTPIISAKEVNLPESIPIHKQAMLQAGTSRTCHVAETMKPPALALALAVPRTSQTR
jgi:hypothetical protein